MPPWMPKRVVVNTPGTTFTRSSTAERPNRSIVSSLMTETERGVSSSGLLKPNDDSLGAFGRIAIRIGRHDDYVADSTPDRVWLCLYRIAEAREDQE